MRATILLIAFIFLSLSGYSQNLQLSVDGVVNGNYCVPSTSTQLTVTLRITPGNCGGGNYNINWGDGKTQDATQNSVTHVYDLRTFQQATGVSRFPLTISVANNNCTQTFPFYFIKAPRAAATVQASCSGAPVAFINNSLPQGQTGVTYKWEFSDGQSSTEYSPFLEFSSNGTYTLTVSTPQCGSNSVSGSFQLRPLPEAKFEAVGFTEKEGELIVCQSDSAVLQLDGGSSLNHNAYTWSVSGGQYDRVSPNLTSRFAKINLKEEKEYTVTLNVRHTACVASQTSISKKFRVVKDDVPKLTPQPDACQPIEYKVPTIVANTSYTINGAEFNPAQSQPLGYSSQPYIVTARLTNSCGSQVVSDTFKIEQIQQVSILNVEDEIGVCVNSDEIVLETNTDDGIWKGGTPQDGKMIFDPKTIGVYELIYYKGSGLCYVGDTVTIRVNNDKLDKINFTPDVTSGCKSANITFSIEEAEDKNYSYEWNFGNGQTATGYAPPPQLYENDSREKKTFLPLLKVDNGCVAVTSSYPLEIHAEIKAELGIDSTTIRCDNSPILFSNRSTGHEKILSIWDFGDGTIRTTPSDTVYHLFPATGGPVFNVKLKVEGACGNDETEVKIRVSPEVHALFTMPDQVCPGEQVVFKDATVPAPDRWVWTFGDGNVSSDANPVHTFAEPNKEYKVVLTAYTACGTDTISRIIKTTTSPEASFELSSNISCKDSEVNFINSSDPQLGFIWDFGDGTLDSVNFSPNYAYSTEGVKEVSLMVYAGSKACNNSTKKAIKINPALTVDFEVSNQGTICAPGPVILANRSQNANTYEWYFNDQLTTQVESPAIPLPNGTYTVKLVASYNGNCRDSLELPMAFTLEPCELNIPEAFTPNNDKFGDNYTFFGSGIQKINFLKIRNRWGEVIFEMFDVPPGSQQPGESWDGTVNGVHAPADTYVYEAEITYIDNSVSDKLRGNFYLVR